MLAFALAKKRPKTKLERTGGSLWITTSVHPAVSTDVAVLEKLVATGRSGARSPQALFWKSGTTPVPPSEPNAPERVYGGMFQPKLDGLPIKPAEIRWIWESVKKRHVSRINTYDLQPESQPGLTIKAVLLPDFSMESRVMRQ
jgi:hypothetical protein